MLFIHFVLDLGERVILLVVTTLPLDVGVNTEVPIERFDGRYQISLYRHYSVPCHDLVTSILSCTCFLEVLALTNLPTPPVYTTQSPIPSCLV